MRFYPPKESLKCINECSQFFWTTCFHLTKRLHSRAHHWKDPHWLQHDIEEAIELILFIREPKFFSDLRAILEGNQSRVRSRVRILLIALLVWLRRLCLVLLSLILLLGLIVNRLCGRTPAMRYVRIVRISFRLLLSLSSCVVFSSSLLLLDMHTRPTGGRRSTSSRILLLRLLILTGLLVLHLVHVTWVARSNGRWLLLNGWLRLWHNLSLLLGLLLARPRLLLLLLSPCSSSLVIGITFLSFQGAQFFMVIFVKDKLIDLATMLAGIAIIGSSVCHRASHIL